MTVSILKFMLKAITSPKTIVKGTIANLEQESKKQEVNTKDKFFVNSDGSISLNPHSEAVQKAFAANIEKLRPNKKD
ncbi:hypothetical protein ACLPD9_02890 [Proteus mirabilis]|uniref:hypothetical protein n=1 Tax=Proteus mirabilis TaxID=584 RepID=UPI0029F204AD|nr:hypothetical protein [Proteus mirabilis]HEK1082146.1 hypothetical protein [Proteus mirabilis]HEK1718357.1 hypothetical protein [Proteus mirabilis]HEK2724312.1 hypothetical protein [Proteus mirabilis]